jgi:hypothetical protein
VIHDENERKYLSIVVNKEQFTFIRQQLIDGRHHDAKEE